MKKEWFVKAVISFFNPAVRLRLGLDFFLLYASCAGEWICIPSFHALILRSGGPGVGHAGSAFVIYAVVKMRSHRLEAYRLFKNAVLVQIFMVQVFLFYKAQFLALLGLAGTFVSSCY